MGILIVIKLINAQIVYILIILFSKTSDNDENAAFQEHKGKESLVNKCIRTIAVNFDKNPNIDGLPEKLLPKLVDQLSLTYR